MTIARRLQISPDIVTWMCRPTERPFNYRVTRHGIPPDAKCVDVAINRDHEAGPLIVLLLESGEFTEDTPDPLPAPEITRYLTEADIAQVEEKELCQGPLCPNYCV